MNNVTGCYNACARADISKERKLRTLITVGALLIISGKVHIIFNFGSKTLRSGARIEKLCGRVIIGATHFI